MKKNIQNRDNLKTENNTSNYGTERLIISGIINFITGLIVLLGLISLRTPVVIAVTIAILSAITGVILLTKKLPFELIGIRKRKPLLSIVWLLLALVSLLLITRLSVFMLDPVQTQYSLFPGDKWMTEHCCLTAYSESARFVSVDEKNIYKQELYFGEEFSKNKELRRKLDGFQVDLFHYPPPFLLLPLITRAIVSGDFLNLRILWFALSLLTLMLAIGLIIYRLESEGRMRMIGMAPLILCSMPVLSGLQMLNVQIIIIAISIIAMALFHINRPIGGLILAMSSVAKIFPGILFVYLIAQRKLREAVWVAGFAIVLFIITFIVVGSNPFLVFIEYELPRLSSGEAFSGPFSRAFAVARNMSPFGIPIKLGWLGVPNMTLEIGRIVSSIYLLIVLALAIWAGRQQPRSNTETVSLWISLICLGSLVSPFAPANYVLVSLIILVSLNRELFSIWAVSIIWLIICLPFLISREAPFLIQALSFLPSQILALGVPGLILYRAGKRNTQEQKNISKASVSAEV